MSTTPTIPEAAADLTAAPLATLSTIGPDGRPQVSPLWFLFEEGRFRISLNTSRQKAKNLAATPVGTMVVLDPSGMRYLEVRGDATIEADTDYAFADRVGAKYDADLRQMDNPGEQRVTVTFEPSRVNYVDMAAT